MREEVKRNMQYYVDHHGNVLTSKEYAEITGQKPRETQQQKTKQEEEKKEGRVCTQ